MLTYRASIMLYSSVIALCFLDISKGFASSSLESKASDHIGSKLSKDAKESKDAKLDGAPPSVEDEKKLREKEQELIELEQRKKAFLKRIEVVTSKNSSGLQYVIGKDINVEARIQEKNEKIIRGLNTFKQNIVLEKTKKFSTLSTSDDVDNRDVPANVIADGFDKTDEYSNTLSKKIERMYSLISSKKQSVADDAAWFKQVYDNATGQLNQLKDLRAKFKKLKQEKAESTTLDSLYSEAIENFLSSYRVMAVTESYLLKGADYCKNKDISNHFMKHFFPHFSDEAFKVSAGSIDMIAGDQRRAITTAFDSHLFYPIDAKLSKEYLSADAPKDSDDSKLMNRIKKKLASGRSEDAEIKDLMKVENGGIITAYNIMLRDGMSAPLCVYTAVSCNTNSEGEIKEYMTRRFSIVERQTGADSVDLTKQFIDAEQKESREKVENANNAFREEIRAAEEQERLDKKQEAAKIAKEKLKDKAKSDKAKSKDSSNTEVSHDLAPTNSESTLASKEGSLSASKGDQSSDRHSSDSRSSSDNKAERHQSDDSKPDDKKTKEDKSKDADKAKPTTEKNDNLATTASGSSESKERVSTTASGTSTESGKNKGKPSEATTSDSKPKPAEEKKGIFGGLFGGKSTEQTSASVITTAA